MYSDAQYLNEEHQRARSGFWLTVGLAVILAGIVAALLMLLVRANENYQESLAQQTKSMEVINTTRALDVSLARAEAALGRFAIGLVNDDGLIFDEQWRRSRAYLNQLENNVRTSPVQLASVKDLRKELERRENFLFSVARSANYNRSLAAISRYHAAGLDDGLLRIERLLNKIISTERVELRQRSIHTEADRESLSRAMWLFSLIGAGTAIFAIGSAFSLIRANGERRLAQLEQQAEFERSAELEYAVRSRTAELADANAALRNEMTERERAEAKLRQAQKMEAVGQLTGGIAHDFNNMLAVVVGGLELAERWMEKAPDKARQHLANALDGVHRATDLTRRLLTFARAEPARPVWLEIDGCIRGFASLIDRSIGDRIALTLDLQAGDAKAKLDQHQFENALLNLAVNGRDAMDGSGQLTIRTRLDDPEDPKSVSIQVVDNGCGMEEEVMQRIFDPFFTTKPSGKGTGLGMSQVFAFSRQSHGEVKVQSTVGEGTSVAILLPVVSGAEPENDKGGEARPDMKAISGGHSYHLLVVEDDPRVLQATTASLQELGHRVISCPDPRQGRALLEANPEVDLLISDVMMPEMTGPELAASLRETWPDLPVIFVTGYAGDAQEMGNAEEDVLLRKPFTLAALDQAIRARMEKGQRNNQRLEQSERV